MRQRPKHRKLQLQALTISCICSFLFIGAYLIFYDKAPSPPPMATASDLPPPTISEEVDASYPTLNHVTETAQQDAIDYTLHYALTESDTVNKEITDYIDKVKQAFAQQIQATQDGKLTMELTVIPYQHDFVTLQLQQTITTPKGTHMQVKTFLYDLQQQQLISFKELLNNDEQHLQQMAQLVHTYFEIYPENKALEGHFFKHGATTPRWEDFEQFILQDDQLVLPIATAHEVFNVTLAAVEVNALFAKPYQQMIAPVLQTVPKDYQLDTTKKHVALTFDDGPHPKVTPQILDLLKKYDAKATFFMLGNRVTEHPELVQRIVAEGHELGNHTWSHPNLRKLPLEAVQQEFISTNEAIINATGYEPSLFRPPYGATSADIQAAIPLPSINWSIDTLDWKHRSAQQTIEAVNYNMHDNAIILMHDIHQPTADALEQILINLQNANYECVTVSEVNMYLNQ